MKELEEVNCEIRRIINLQFPMLNRLRNLETEEHGQSAISQEHDNVTDCRGGFLHNATYAWLSYGCHLVVFNVKIGESVSSWTFRGIVTSVSQLPAQSGEFPLLLVGIDNYASRLKDSSGLLCIFDCTASRVLRAIRIPCGVEQVCVVTGGAEWEEFNDKRPDNILNEMDGIACVVLRNLQHIMIDLRRSTWDIHNLSTVMDELSPAEIDLSTKQVVGRHQSNKERHAAYNLLNSRIEKHIGFNRENFESSPLLSENLTTAIISSMKIGCLISGCLGRVIIWQNDGSIGWISAPIDDMVVTHLALLEPTDDPRPFYYLWVVFQDESSKAPPILRMYAMLFERKYCDRGMNLYFNLEADPSLKFESELNEGDKVVSLCTVERESNPEQTESGARRGEDNLLLIGTNERILLFDLNQWYKEQMPHTIGECQNPNSILATYRTRSDADDQIVSFAYVPLSLQEFPSNGPSSPEELFYPNSLSLEWIELSTTKLTFWMTRGIQADLLREIALAGPIILIQPSETFHKCLSVGLVPFNSEFSFTSDQNAQREMLLSLCLEQRWSTFLVKCAVEWSDGSASYLYPTFLKWGVQRASVIKMIADRLCVPLFDQSGSSIGEADVKTLRFCSQQLECLSGVVGKLPSATADLTKQQRTLKRVSTYFQVLLWFYDVGLLPETQDLEEEGTLRISLTLRVPYPYEKLSALYREKRAQLPADSGGNENEEDLFIDELITRECSVLKTQWEREGGTVMAGYYPPPSLQSLLRSYLADCHQTEANEISCKHQITIYLLMDLAMLLQRLYPAVDQLIKYPSAFKMSPSLIKLTQAFWLLDHEDYQGFLDMMTGQLVSDSDVRDWHHRLILRTLVRNNQHKLALVYLRVRKPPLSSMEEQGVAMSLSVEHGLAQSAFHRRPPCHYEQLLTCFFRACKKYGKLTEILHLALDSEEEEVFIKFLEENKTEDLRLLYYLQRCRYTEAISGHTFRQYESNFTKNIQSTSHNMLSAYNTTLPDIIKQFSTSTAASNMDVDLKARYPRPMSHCKSHDKLRNIYETVIAKAKETYLRGEKCQIPFVSAPCTSLKLNSYSANTNCVLFPALAPKSRGKRTVDQIYEAEDANVNDTPDNAKRRKLSDENISLNRQDPKETGLTAVFETPLVKRKLNASAKDKETVSETPQSILKIKQLIRNCPSPDVTLSETVEVTDGPSDNEREKKINRQIRFNFNQSKKALMYEEEEEEEEEKEKEEESGNNLSVSDEMFFSPNANEKSAYYESTVLSDNSSISSSMYRYARPRPSLRRSALSLVESPQASCATKANDTSVNLSAITSSCHDDVKKQSFVSNTSTRCDSLMTSIYSSSVLDSDTSVDITFLKKPNRSSNQSRRKSSTEMDYNNKSIISSTPMMKSKAPEPRVKVDDEEKKFVLQLMQELDATDLSNSEKVLNIEHPDYGRSDLPERRDSSEKDSAQGKSQQSETRYNNGSIARKESPSLQNLYEEQPASTEIEMEAAEIVSDESDEELLRLQDTEEEDDEHEEEFESVSTVQEDVQEMDPVISSSENWNLQCGTEEHGAAKSNGLREFMQVMANVDFTDDESTKSRGVTPVISDKTGNNEKENYSLPIVPSHDILCDMSNITDDESDSNTREIEKPKAKNGRVSNLTEQHVTQSVDAEKNSESDERSRRSSRRESVSKKNASQILSQPDVDNESRSVHSSRKVDRSRLEMSTDSQKLKESIESQEKLSETKSSSTSKRSQIETTKSPVVMLTKLTTKDATVNTSLQQEEPERVTRLRTRRGSSVTKDSPSRSITESLRSRRASSMAKDAPVDSPSQDADAEEPPPQLHRATSDTFGSSEASSQETNYDKPPRLRRAGSITKDVDSPSGKPRGRRASSLAKEVLISVEDLATPSEKSVRRNSRSISVTKEIEVKDNDTESVKDDIPVRRSTRLASVKREYNSSKADTQKSLAKSESELVKLTSDDEEDKNTRKRSLRARTSSVSSDTEKPTTSRSLRSSTRDSKEELEEVEVKTRRRRGSSVPKEATARTARIRRSSSIIKEIIPEEAEPPEEKTESRRLRSSTARTANEVVNKLTTRSRSASLLSIPEELEEILSPSLRETRSTRKKEALKTNTRRRRAISVDVPQNELKKRVRNIHSRNLASPIIEESVDEKIQLQEDDKSENEETPVPRRRAASMVKEMEKVTEKRKRGKTSANEESSNLFSFSQPEKTDDMPLDEKDIGEVPNYVFSLPKSKIPPDQPQK
ncbi:protein ELYS isoform X2 [Linepithema humile]|uniref:protein ELYS isoform X2 n=1 Tax=Linepithema humile TaxID=83485 RepID=UPI00351DC196